MKSIAIIGAGPAGLAAALFLHRLGHSIAIFEQFDTPKPVGSGLLLQPTGQAVLRELGLLDSVLGSGQRIDALEGTDVVTGRVVLDVRYSALKGDRFGIGIHRAALFDVLFDAVREAGIAIETGFRVSGQGGSGAGSLRFANAAEVRGFDLVVDASGTRCVMGEYAWRPTKRSKYAYGALWVSLDWRGARFPQNMLSQRYERASMMIGVLPTGERKKGSGQEASFFWSIRPQDYPAVQQAGIECWKSRLRHYWPETSVFLDQIDDWDQMTLARYEHNTLLPAAGRQIAFLGDAAHSTSPQLGQGANMALLDAAALAASFAERVEMEDILADYARRRRLHVWLFQTLSHIFTPFYQSDSSVYPFFRNWLAAPISRIPPGPQLLAAMVSGTLGSPLRTIDISRD